MGTIADSLFTVLMSWVRALVNAIWALFSSDHTTMLEFLGRHWAAIALGIIVVGLVVDRLVWLIRWRPYHLLAVRLRSMLHIGDQEEDAAQEDTSRYAPPPQPVAQEEPEEDWLPEPPTLDENDAQEVLSAAESVPDEDLGQYPGMRYDSRAAYAPPGDMEGTRRYAAVHAEGPGAAEVSRRRAEIDAWQLQMQEEARQRAEAERAAREAQAAYEAEQQRLAQEAYEAEQQRLAQAAYEAEQQRLAQEAYEAEQQRLAQEAYEAEQQRLAQEEYERQLAEYEWQKAQYERDLAEYERQKAEYDAAMARQNVDMEAAQELPDTSATARRRRRVNATYSDYVAGEDVGELPDPPAWTQMERPVPQQAPREDKPKAEKKGLLRGGVERMARMIEPEQEEITGITSLPPRVDPGEAYRPAKRPPKK